MLQVQHVLARFVIAQQPIGDGIGELFARLPGFDVMFRQRQDVVAGIANERMRLRIIGGDVGEPFVTVFFSAVR